MCLLAGSRNCKPSIALLNNPQTERQLVARPALPEENNFSNEASLDQGTQILNSALPKRTCQPMKNWGLPLAMGGPFLLEPEPQNGVDFQDSCREDGRTAWVRKEQYNSTRISQHSDLVARLTEQHSTQTRTSVLVRGLMNPISFAITSLIFDRKSA